MVEVVPGVEVIDCIQKKGMNLIQKKNLRKLQLIQEFLNNNKKVDVGPTIQQPTKEELASEKCYFDYSPPTFKGDIRFSCQHKTRSGELQHRELIVVIPHSSLLHTLGKNNALRGKALEEFYEKEHSLPS